MSGLCLKLSLETVLVRLFSHLDLALDFSEMFCQLRLVLHLLQVIALLRRHVLFLVCLLRRCRILLAVKRIVLLRASEHVRVVVGLVRVLVTHHREQARANLVDTAAR